MFLAEMTNAHDGYTQGSMKRAPGSKSNLPTLRESADSGGHLIRRGPACARARRSAGCPGSISHHVATQVVSEKGQVADQVKNLVAGRLSA